MKRSFCDMMSEETAMTLTMLEELGHIETSTNRIRARARRQYEEEGIVNLHQIAGIEDADAATEDEDYLFRSILGR